MEFIGLDLSLTGTGCAHMGYDRECKNSKLINPNNAKGVRRLQHIRDEVMDFLPMEGRLVVCVEGYAMGARGNNMFDIGELGGIIKLALMERGDLVCLLAPPTNLKQFVAGSGNVDKERVVRAVNRLLHLRLRTKGSDHNIADAWGLAMIARHWYRKPRETDYEGRAMSKIKPCFPIPFRPES